MKFVLLFVLSAGLRSLSEECSKWKETHNVKLEEDKNIEYECLKPDDKTWNFRIMNSIFNTVIFQLQSFVETPSKDLTIVCYKKITLETFNEKHQIDCSSHSEVELEKNYFAELEKRLQEHQQFTFIQGKTMVSEIFKSDYYLPQLHLLKVDPVKGIHEFQDTKQ